MLVPNQGKRNDSDVADSGPTVTEPVAFAAEQTTESNSASLTPSTQPHGATLASDQTVIRIGAVSYLNTKPLIESAPRFLDAKAALSVALPSELADQMHRGSLDVALVPCIEFFRHPDWEIVSDACIGCNGPVWSVKLLFRTEPSQVRTMSLDVGSRTSAVLAQVLMIEKHAVRPETRLLAIEEDPLDCVSDCVLVIGDRAMHDSIGGPFVEEWDLGQVWKQHTGLPFVFAMWVARQIEPEKRRLLRSVADGLSKSRDAGLAAVEEISSKYASQYGLSIDSCHRYLSHYLNYHLDQASRAGMDLYYSKAIEYQLL